MLYAKWTSGGGNGGTWNNPVVDTTTQTYDPDDVEEGTTLYENVPGEPEVTKENGKITRFEYTDTGNNGITVPNGGIDTGIIAFDGSDMEIELKARYTYSSFPASGMAPVLNLSVYENNQLNGVLLGVTMNSQGTAYDETGTSLSVRSNNKAAKFRLNKYENGEITSGIDYYHQLGTNAYYSNRFSTRSSTFDITVKLHYHNQAFTSEIYYNNGIIAKLQLASSGAADRTLPFTSSLANATIQLGKWVDRNGNSSELHFNVLEFSVNKT